MKLSLPSRVRIDDTWSVSGSKGRDSGFIDIRDGAVYYGNKSYPEYSYTGCATTIELNHWYNHWTVVQIDNGGYSGNDPAVQVVLFPSKRWFDEWFAAIPAERNPKVLARCAECKTGVE